MLSIQSTFSLQISEHCTNWTGQQITTKQNTEINRQGLVWIFQSVTNEN